MSFATPIFYTVIDFVLFGCFFSFFLLLITIRKKRRRKEGKVVCIYKGKLNLGKRCNFAVIRCLTATGCD